MPIQLKKSMSEKRNRNDWQRSSLGEAKNSKFFNDSQLVFLTQALQPGKRVKTILAEQFVAECEKSGEFWIKK